MKKSCRAPVSVVLHLADGWAWLDNIVHVEVGGAVTELEGGLVTRLVEEEEVARHHRLLPTKEKGDRTFHHWG